MTLLDLFSGIGGFSLGLERAGFRTVAFCEIDPWCRRVLAKHWPKVPIYDDVRTVDAARLRADGIERIDAICGGFPCQDISLAGKGAGLDGERSGLWREYARIIGDVRPRHAIVENVGAIRGRGLLAVLADLAALGYDAEWHSIPAAAVGAPHLRDRVWIVATDTNAASEGRRRDGAHGAIARDSGETLGAGQAQSRRLGSTAADADRRELRIEPRRRSGAGGSGAVLARSDGEAGSDTDAHGERRERRGIAQHRDEQGAPGLEPDGLGARGWRDGQAAPEPERQRREELRGLFGPLARSLAAVATPWERTTEPPLCGLDDGVANRLARPALKALGNSVVPQIPEIIGRALIAGAA